MTDEYAREQLGKWLAAEPGRTWDDWSRFSTVEKVVALMPHADDFPNCRDPIEGTGPTLAEAILNALDLVNNHDEPNGPDNVTREDFARDEWKR